jgi:hypothetical protein
MPSKLFAPSYAAAPSCSRVEQLPPDAADIIPPSVGAVEFHPAAAIFDLLGGREFDALCEDIRKSGLRLAVWLHPDGRILDGRNRYRACLAVGIEPHFQT